MATPPSYRSSMDRAIRTSLQRRGFGAPQSTSIAKKITQEAMQKEDASSFLSFGERPLRIPQQPSETRPDAKSMSTQQPRPSSVPRSSLRQPQRTPKQQTSLPRREMHSSDAAESSPSEYSSKQQQTVQFTSADPSQSPVSSLQKNPTESLTNPDKHQESAPSSSLDIPPPTAEEFGDTLFQDDAGEEEEGPSVTTDVPEQPPSTAAPEHTQPLAESTTPQTPPEESPEQSSQAPGPQEKESELQNPFQPEKAASSSPTEELVPPSALPPSLWGKKQWEALADQPEKSTAPTQQLPTPGTSPTESSLPQTGQISSTPATVDTRNLLDQSALANRGRGAPQIGNDPLRNQSLSPSTQSLLSGAPGLSSNLSRPGKTTPQTTTQQDAERQAAFQKDRYADRREDKKKKKKTQTKKDTISSLEKDITDIQGKLKDLIPTPSWFMGPAFGTIQELLPLIDTGWIAAVSGILLMIATAIWYVTRNETVKHEIKQKALKKLIASGVLDSIPYVNWVPWNIVVQINTVYGFYAKAKEFAGELWDKKQKLSQLRAKLQRQRPQFQQKQQ